MQYKHPSTLNSWHIASYYIWLLLLLFSLGPFSWPFKVPLSTQHLTRYPPVPWPGIFAGTGTTGITSTCSCPYSDLQFSCATWVLGYKFPQTYPQISHFCSDRVVGTSICEITGHGTGGLALTDRTVEQHSSSLSQTDKNLIQGNLPFSS